MNRDSKPKGCSDSPRHRRNQPTVHGSLTVSGRISWLILLYGELYWERDHFLDPDIPDSCSLTPSWEGGYCLRSGYSGDLKSRNNYTSSSLRSFSHSVGRRQQFRRAQDEPRSLSSKKVVKERKLCGKEWGRQWILRALSSASEPFILQSKLKWIIYCYPGRRPWSSSTL